MAQPFLGAHVYRFASGLSILVASLLVWMAWVVDDLLKGLLIWLVVVFPALVYLALGF